jgi:hypothetical protein
MNWPADLPPLPVQWPPFGTTDLAEFDRDLEDQVLAGLGMTREQVPG